MTTKAVFKALFTYIISISLAATAANTEYQTDMPESIQANYGDERYIIKKIFNSDERLPHFNKKGNVAVGGVVTKCKLLIDVPAGTARGNHSYGGFCTLHKGENNQSIKVCDDEMIGHFAFEETNDENIDVLELGKFVYEHCVGG